MIDPNEPAVPPGLADLPLDVRRAREVEREREIQDGLARRHLAETGFEQTYAAVQFDRLLRAAPTIAAKLRGD